MVWAPMVALVGSYVDASFNMLTSMVTLMGIGISIDDSFGRQHQVAALTIALSGGYIDDSFGEQCHQHQ